MTDLGDGLIIAFGGAFSALILGLVKEYFENGKKEKSALIQAKYILIKYVNDITTTNRWYREHTKTFNEMFMYDRPLPPNFEQNFSWNYRNALSFQIYENPGLDSAVDLKIKIEDLNYLTERDERLLDAILKSMAQYSKIISIIKERNAHLRKLQLNFVGTKAPQEMKNILLSHESDIVQITDELFNTLQDANKDIENAIEYLKKVLNTV